MWGLEIRKPSKQSVIGFAVAWLCVLAIILLTLVVVRIGA